MSELEDLRERVRELEQARVSSGERLATVEAASKMQGELVRAVAPLVGDLATVRGIANSALDKVNTLEKETKGDRIRRLATSINIATAIVAIAGLIFVILTFAGVGHG